MSGLDENQAPTTYTPFILYITPQEPDQSVP